MNYSELLPYGLSVPEAKVYLAALELGESTAERIAQKARVNRTSVYHTFSLLRKKNLLTLHKKGRKAFYTAEDPKRIKEMAENKIDALDRLLPNLRALSTAIDKKPSVGYFEGPEEIRNLYLKLLDRPESEVQFWFSEEEQTPEYVRFWDTLFAKKRIEKRIFARGISKNTAKAIRQKEKDLEQFRKTRLDVNPSCEISSEILLSGDDRTFLISHKNMLGLLVEDKAIHDTLKSIFESHWESLGR